MVQVSTNLTEMTLLYQSEFDAIYSAQGLQSVTITSTSVLGIFALCGTVLLLLGIGMGAGMGALGGLLGRSQSPFKPVPPNYMGQPPYGYNQPPMPPPPYYPEQNPPPYQG